VKAKARKEVERKKVVEEEEKKERTLEYLQQLQNKVLEEEAALLEGTEGSQVMGSKHKEVISRNKEEQQLFKKARGKQSGKYHGSIVVKMKSVNPCERCVSTRQDCLVYYSR